MMTTKFLYAKYNKQIFAIFYISIGVIVTLALK